MKIYIQREDDNHIIEVFKSLVASLTQMSSFTSCSVAPGTPVDCL